MSPVGHSCALPLGGFYGKTGSMQTAQINRELDRVELLIQQIKDVEEARDALLVAADEPTPALLLSLKGIGPEFAAVLWSEGLSRKFDNRRQVAAYAGLVPTPWQSGQINCEQGVSKSGNPRLRSTLVQFAWLWVRHQPNSALSQWFRARVIQNGGRYKKTRGAPGDGYGDFGFRLMSAMARPPLVIAGVGADGPLCCASARCWRPEVGPDGRLWRQQLLWTRVNQWPEAVCLRL